MKKTRDRNSVAGFAGIRLVRIRRSRVLTHGHSSTVFTEALSSYLAIHSSFNLG
ncbi:hypothetical protein K7J14_02990 [Treponema zuelzerae]|uniref:Uncharacterized protein n=1 Tax=Teretinema zuelzerae TaxID=156 RepID=A0AAE3EFG5_9SPIR|nr:hypothetical protein [Teretinema zuelzerae]MCD1653664.1 hypothetical protein [Teretinema zuelzerae]